MFKSRNKVKTNNNQKGNKYGNQIGFKLIIKTNPTPLFPIRT